MRPCQRSRRGCGAAVLGISSRYVLLHWDYRPVAIKLRGWTVQELVGRCVGRACGKPVDPDVKRIKLIEENLDLNMLCELLRCDSTDMENLGGDYLAYIDGEGSFQGRQKEWEFNENVFWGPVLIVKIGKDRQKS